MGQNKDTRRNACWRCMESKEHRICVSHASEAGKLLSGCNLYYNGVVHSMTYREYTTTQLCESINSSCEVRCADCTYFCMTFKSWWKISWQLHISLSVYFDSSVVARPAFNDTKGHEMTTLYM